MLRLWVEIPEPERLEKCRAVLAPSRRHSVHSPLERPSVRIRPSSHAGAFGRRYGVPRVGRTRGRPLGPLAEFGRKIEWEGARLMRVKRG